jgi:ABC-2 type transport system ATP-binding protein
MFSSGGDEPMVQPMPPPVATIPDIPSPEPKPRETIIEARELDRRFGDVHAVRGVSFSVGKGEVFGFFGPNGAGKTTTMRMLCGLLAPSAGRAIVAGYDVGEKPTRTRRAIAIMNEEVTFYEKMSPGQYLKFFSKMAGAVTGGARERYEKAVRTAEIEGFLGKPIKNLSHGQRQKISIARALLSEVPVMFLDEPFQGIDIIHRKAMREYIRAYATRGGTVFFTSHNLIEAEHIVDRFAFIDRGQIIMVGAARELRDKFLLPQYALRVSDLVHAEEVLAQNLATTECYVKGDELVITLVNKDDVPKVTTVLGGAGIALMEMRQLGTMEEVFLNIRKQQGGGM